MLALSVIRDCKRLVDELCWCGVKRLGITNDTFERISRMLKRNRFVSLVQTREFVIKTDMLNNVWIKSVESALICG